MSRTLPEEKEVWWIHSDHSDYWAGLRIAVFSKARNDNTDLFIILGDLGPRCGVRIWDDVSRREGWRKIERITVPQVLT